MEFTFEHVVAVGLIALFAGAAVGGWVAAWMLSPTDFGKKQEGGKACGSTR